MKLNLIEIKMIINLLETRIAKIEEELNSESDKDVRDYLISDVTDHEMLLRKMRAEIEVRG